MDAVNFSCYMQAWSNPNAVDHLLKTFRCFYPDHYMRIVGNDNYNFSELCDRYNIDYEHSDKEASPGKYEKFGPRGRDLYIERIYDTCQRAGSKWIILLEEDCRFLRKIERFPEVPTAGPRMNSYSRELQQYFHQKGLKSYMGYGLSGGSIFNREIFIRCYEKGVDWDHLASLEPRINVDSDVALNVLFQYHGYEYQVWDEVSELFHKKPAQRIYREAAIDHAYKHFYDLKGEKDREKRYKK